jgi:hypothetical protein
MFRFTAIILAVVMFVPTYAQKAKHPELGWDLTYATLLVKNNVGGDTWLSKWVGPNYHSPAKRLIDGWRGEPIVSSVLIDAPAPHAAEPYTMWFVRTKDHAYHWEFVTGKRTYNAKEPMDPQLYDKFFAALSSWQQAKPVKPEDTPDGAIPGYMGFLSLYDYGKSRQNASDPRGLLDV